MRLLKALTAEQMPGSRMLIDTTTRCSVSSLEYRHSHTDLTNQQAKKEMNACSHESSSGRFMPVLDVGVVGILLERD